MTSLITRLAFLLAAVLAAPVAAQAPPIIVGAVISQSGPHAEQAAGYLNGLSLWRDELNAAGGMLGRKVELRILDDESEAVRAGKLYLQLIREDTDLLIGPYGTAATMMGAAEAESARRVFINGAGPSRGVHKRSPRYVFQTAVPYNAFGTGALQLAREEGYKRIFIAARDDAASREMADAAKDTALRLGLSAGDVDLYAGGTEDFLPQVLKAQAAKADAWIVFGEVRDAAQVIKTLRINGYAPRLFFVRGASDQDLKSAVGQDAELALGARAYDARFNTQGNQKFVQAYATKHSSRPGLAAAEGYAAGTVLAEGVKLAGTVDQGKLRAALATMETRTVLGEHKVDALTGEQIAATAAITQIIRGRVEVVWPPSSATAQRVAPYPKWNERRILKK